MNPGRSEYFEGDQEQHRADPLADEPVGGDIYEGLGLQFELFGERLKENFASRLVQAVTEGGIRNAGHHRRPQNGVEQDEKGGGAQTHRQHQQCEADAEDPVNAAREVNLDDKADCRQEKCNPRQETDDTVFTAYELLGGHVELLLDGYRAQSCKPDHERDES